MMIVIIITILTQYHAHSQTTATTSSTLSTEHKQCTCSNIQIEKECLSLNCFWNGKVCSNQDSDQVIQTYCELFNSEQCNNVEGCAYVSKKCVAFAGCNLFSYTSDEQCQSTSTKCISDGEKCIELNDCTNYLNQISCNKDQNEILCYWNTQKMQCEYPTSCEQLPNSLNSDQLCRKQLKTCTAKEGGGCEISQENCENQKIELACVTNKDQTKLCIWDQNKCKDKICVNAPTTKNDHQQCNSYLTTCTVNDVSNGCQDIPELCSSLNKQQNCVINKSGNICYWNKNTSKCEDKNCDNAPDEYQNNDQCLSWLPSCVVKSIGFGCQTQTTDCVQYTIENQCIQTITNAPCFWKQNKCYSKICDNAPDTNINHDQCEQFLSTCTVQQDLTGCESKKTSCSNYQKEEQCVSLLDGSPCIFQNNICIPRICINASTKLTTDQACKQFSSTCMVNPNKQGCILQECTSITNKEQCTQDYQNNQCYFATKCEARTCENAPNSFTTDEDCRKFLSQCTVDDDLSGCKVRPLSCPSLNEKQCTTLTNGTKCSWNDEDQNNKSCRLFNCADIPIDDQSEETCSNFDSSCTIAENPSLCMQKPAICDNVKTKDHCLAIVLADRVSKCSWNEETQKCRYRVCSDAYITYLTQDNCKQLADDDCKAIAEDNCRSFMSSCTINDDATSCIQEPDTCSGYKNSKICNKLMANPNNIIYCGWNGCEDRNCSNAPILLDQSYTHKRCNEYLNTCTLNNNQQGCVPLFSSCDAIKNQTQCNDTILIDNTRCTYDLNLDPLVCRGFQCADNISFDMTHDLCASLSNKCTLGVGGIGCVNKFNLCSDIQDEIQCNGTLKSDNKQCFWDATSKPPVCKDRLCSFGQFYKDYKECELFMNTCTKGGINQNCIDKPSQCNGLSEAQCNNVKLLNGGFCSYDTRIIADDLKCHNRICTDAPSSYTTDFLCRKWLPNCTVKADQSGCTVEGNECSDLMREQCFQILSTGKKCFWNIINGTGNCREALCSDASDTDFSTNEQCKSFISTCTAGQNGGCITQPTSCSGLGENHCSKVEINAANKIESENKCSWNIKNKVCQDRKCADAPLSITNEKDCRKWLKKCTIGFANKGCIEDFSACDQVQTKEQCFELSNGQKCGWSTGCVGRQCSNAPDSYTTDEDCRNYLSKCTVQADGTGCELRQSSCFDIQVEIQCVRIDDNIKCFWDKENNQCLQRYCDNAPKKLISHQACQEYLLTCTVNIDGKGCQNKLDKCQSYTTISQCINIKHIQFQNTLTGNSCQWITNNDTQIQQCVDILTQCSSYVVQNACTFQKDNQKCIWIDGLCYKRLCQHAPKSLSTHEKCQEFGSNCTTNGRGCMTYKKCSDYKYSSACKVGIDGNCTLVDQCQKISCESAPTNYKTDSECSSFLKKCTTNGNGCVEKKRCQDAYIIEACKQNGLGGQCAWVNNKCLDKSCETAPLSILTEKECEEYFPGFKCTTKKGGGCVEKSKCKDVQIEIACTTQYDEKQCSWQNGVCKLKSCSDLYGTDHQTCNSQQDDCTTDGLKCTSMQTCSSTSIQKACIKGTDGPCLWSQGQCFKFTKCTDLIFNTHQKCNNIHPECIIQSKINLSFQNYLIILISYFIYLLKTNQRQTHLSKMIFKYYLMIDKHYSYSFQQLLQHLFLKKLIFRLLKKITVKQLKIYFLYQNLSISKMNLGFFNTTNGINCIAISTCENTSKIGCFVGITDLKTIQCVWTPLSINLTALQQCVQFTDCKNVYYLNHNDCYYFSLGKCTSDGILGCIPLNSCNEYKNQISCVIDKAGKQVLQSGKISSTGLCYWNNNQCFPTKCSQLQGSTHQECNSQLNSCTSDGKICILQSSCGSLKNYNSCLAATHLDGKCAWIKEICVAMKCSDYPISQCALQSYMCILNGSECVQISQCNNYKTQYACDQGDSSKVCAWVTNDLNKNECIDVNQCSDATPYEKACKSLSDRCYWKSNTENTSICQPKTCEIQTDGTCTGFYDWQKENYTICGFDKDKKCVKADPTSLTQDECLVKTLYQYSWDSKNSICKICNQINNTQEQPNNSNNTNSTIFSSILFPALIAFVSFQI